MPTLAATQSQVDARYQQIFNLQIRPLQAQYLSRGNRFWQGVITTLRAAIPNNTIPAPTIAEMAPTLTRKPADQAEDWSAVGIVLEPTVPYSIEIRTYRGPRGRGFTARTVMQHGGRFYERMREYHEAGVAGEPQREFDWRVLEIPTGG